MHRKRKCISCNAFIYKSAKMNPYLCRICENELREMETDFPSYFMEH